MELRPDRSSPINTFSKRIGGWSITARDMYMLFAGVIFTVVLFWLGMQIFKEDQYAYFTNVYTEVVSIIATALILDQLNRWRDRRELKQRLFNELRSSAMGQGTAALDWLRRENWIEEDSLEDEDLYRVNWENAYIGDLNFEKATLIGARFANITNVITDDDGEAESKPVNFKQANLRFAHLENAQLWSVDMKSAALVNASLVGADLVSTNLDSVNAREADLSRTRLYRASMKDAYLRKAILIGADLHFANLSGADLREANLTGANLRNATLNYITWQGENYKGNEVSATLPDGEKWSEDTDIEKFTSSSHPEFDATLAKINKIRKQYDLPLLQ